METALTSKRHIYKLAELDRVPAGLNSGTVAPPVLTGLRAHVAQMRQPAGTASPYRATPASAITMCSRGR